MSTTHTEIAWTDRTWNPTRGCSRVSAGCDNCYAMREARRHDHVGGAYEGLTRVNTGRTSHVGVDWSGRVRLIPHTLDEPLHWRKPQKVFVNSMSDLFHEALSDLGINHVFSTMGAASQHTFQILTKRPQRMLDFFAWARVANATVKEWPLPNVWLGVSVEDQATADERIPLLLQTPAAVRFVSYEPALGPVDFTCIEWHRTKGSDFFDALSRNRPALDDVGLDGAALDWLIVGGESGPGARPFDLAWARSAVAQCKAAGVAAFVKQVGARPFDESRFDSSTMRFGYDNADYNRDIALRLKDRKGGDMAEWPSDLRVREFPKVSA